jgi:hypothetical protein
MIHACEISTEPGIQGVRGLLGKENIAGSDPDGFILALREIVEHFHVTWGVTPLHESDSGESVQIGFVVELNGEHAPAAHPVGRTCRRCANFDASPKDHRGLALPSGRKVPILRTAGVQLRSWGPTNPTRSVLDEGTSPCKSSRHAVSVRRMPRLVHDEDDRTAEQDWSGRMRKELAIRRKGSVMNMNIQEEAQASQTSKLKELVVRFQICFEVLPDNYVVDKELREIGFTIELTGTHEKGVEYPAPGCEHCRKVWHALTAVADWIIPREKRDSEYEIVPYDQSIQYNQARKFRAEVSLRIWIRHRCGFDRPADTCEVRCLNEMTQRLKELGVRKQKWVRD